MYINAKQCENVYFVLAFFLFWSSFLLKIIKKLTQKLYKNGIYRFYKRQKKDTK